MVSGSREANVIARDVALATAAASVRIAFMRASGANGLPFLMPIEARIPTTSDSRKSSGSCCTTSFSSSKKVTSLAWTVLICMPEKFTNFCCGGLAAAESGYIAVFAFMFFTMVAGRCPG